MNDFFRSTVAKAMTRAVFCIVLVVLGQGCLGRHYSLYKTESIRKGGLFDRGSLRVRVLDISLHDRRCKVHVENASNGFVYEGWIDDEESVPLSGEEDAGGGPSLHILDENTIEFVYLVYSLSF